MAQPSSAAAYQYPSGHLGHLNAEQQKSFDDFKRLLVERKVYSATGSGPDGSLPTHDDATVLRFLRARRFEPEGAYKQLVDTDKWRKENDIGGLYEWIDRSEYEETRRLYPQWTGRRDKRGVPVYVFEVANLNSKALAAYESSTKLKNPPPSHTSPTSAKLLRLFALYENLTRFALPLCSAASDRPYAADSTPITQSNNIVDISGVGLKQFWDLKAHMQDAATLATAHYPETLDRIFIIGAPSFFPTVWTWVKRWFDPIVVSKMFILSDAEVLPTLSGFMAIEDIPEKYGGQLKFRFGDMPNIGGGLESLLDWKGAVEVPVGTIVWEQGEGGAMQMVNVGSVNGERKREVWGTVKGKSWKQVMYPGSEASSGVQGRDISATPTSSSAATATDAPIGGGNDKHEITPAPVDTVPAVPTAPGPPVSTA